MLTNKKILMGSMLPSWGADKKIKTITFSITDECNLRCTYCYFAHKTHKNQMTFDIAKKAVDNILSEPLYADYDGVVWEFIGGEPTIVMELVDKISDYILVQMYRLKHKWLRMYRFMIGTNGLLYDSEQMQNYIKKHKDNLYVAITIDGNKEKHDLSRIKKDGSGSYDEVKKNIPLWQAQFGGNSTKATFAHDDLPYLKDSIVNLWNLGISIVSANIVFEDVWHPGDEQIYKEQLYALANYIIENDLWDKCSVRFFSPDVGLPYSEEAWYRNFCGTGNMLAINTFGEYYPCVRFMPSATTENQFHKLGDVDTAINTDRLRPFYVLNTFNQSPPQCLKCDIAGGCSWCTGYNYDVSSVGTIFERQTALCAMHKVNVEVNKYLWRQYELIKHEISPYRLRKLTDVSIHNKYMYIMCDSAFPSFCDYKSVNQLSTRMFMDEETLTKALHFCDSNNYVPILCGARELPPDYYAYQIIRYEDYLSLHNKNFENYFTSLIISNIDEIDIANIPSFAANVCGVIITVKASQMDLLKNIIKRITSSNPQITVSYSIIDVDLSPKEYLASYKCFLEDITNFVFECWASNCFVNISSLTNELFANINRPCGAGKNSFTMAPDGTLYLCPGFYYSYPETKIGNIDDGLHNLFEAYCDMDKAPLCQGCDIKHCKRCIYQNKARTGELHIPSELQCVLSHLEYEYSYQLVSYLRSNNLKLPFDYNEKIGTREYYDPLSNLKHSSYPNQGLSEFVASLK